MTKSTKSNSAAGMAPSIKDLPNLSQEEVDLLSKHFEVFSETTNKLVAAQQHLQEQLRVLMEELEKKNRQLESVNQELALKMRESDEVRQFLDRLIDSMQTGLIALDSEGRIAKMNRGACEILGWKKGLPDHFDSIRVPDLSDPIAPVTSSERHAHSGEIRLMKRDGDTVLVRYTAARIETPDAPETDLGDYLFVFEDLSQLRLLEERVRRSDRLTALGELAAGVAHEMRNPLATMRGFLQLLPSEYEDPDFREECSTRLIDEIDRLARLTDDLLELSRPIQPDDRATDLRQLLREVVGEHSETMASEGIQIHDRLEEVPPLPLDRDRLKQVLLNLIINSRQALPDGGNLSVFSGVKRETWGQEDEERDLVFVAIVDDGMGIDPKHMDSLFDPFFTTKDRGTGLGLALCHRIVEEHGGVIRVESSPGKGTSFSLYFPAPSNR
ncbi:MAG: PAS domain S-box protein [Candidatus Omnitrophica bacterium]|nr:PAS domain S-box protein [Candidatus Omnitrophota bacterium]